jgi:phage terminase large subunit-like protein
VLNPPRHRAPDATIRSATCEPSRTNYVAIAVGFAEAAIADRKRTWAGVWIRLAAKRFLRDLNRAQGARPPFTFSADWATRHCRFIEGCPHVEGSWKTSTLRLVPAQIFCVVQLFGFRDRRNGGRRFTEALFAMARKNGKSTFGAAIMLSCECLENEPGAQLLAAATTGPQARIVFKVAKEMVDRTPEMRDAFDLSAKANEINRDETGAVFKPINSKASTQDGLNPSHTILDEIHAHKTHDLMNVLRSAAGARDSALFLYTTTEGYENPGPWAELRAFAQQVLQGVLRADHFLCVIFALDDDDDDFDESRWPKANPLYHTNPKLAREMRKLASNAKAMPGSLAEFQIKRLNRRAAAAQTWVNLHKWRRCGGPVVLDALVGAPCWGAFDLASTTDMTAWRLLWYFQERWYTWGRYWVPADAVAQRTERRTVPYANWVARGLITQTTGDVTDYSIVKRDIVADFGRFQPSKIAFDPWNAGSVVNDLMNDGLPLEQFIQGPRSYQPAFSALEIAYTAGRLNHGGDPVLLWNAANLVPRRDVNLNLAPDRKRSADKIDGFVALLMCFGVAAVDDMEAMARYLANPVSA